MPASINTNDRTQTVIALKAAGEMNFHIARLTGLPLTNIRAILQSQDPAPPRFILSDASVSSNHHIPTLTQANSDMLLKAILTYYRDHDRLPENLPLNDFISQCRHLRVALPDTITAATV